MRLATNKIIPVICKSKLDNMKLKLQKIKIMNNRFNYQKYCALIATLIFGFVFSINTNAQSAITYTYDAHGQLISESYPNMYFLEFEYDEEGNVINKTVSDTLSSPSNKIDAKFNVYPNPAQKGFVINYAFTSDAMPNEMTLHDSNGKIIETIPIKHAKGALYYKCDFSPGVYILKAGKRYSQKVVIF
jgi:YD repeat-containing protein